MDEHEDQGLLRRGLRWLARIGAVISLFVVVLGVSSGFRGDTVAGLMIQRSGYGVLLFPAATHLGLLLAFWRERLGGAIALLSVLGFLAWMYQKDGELPERWPGFLILVAPGLLFLLVGSRGDR